MNTERKSFEMMDGDSKKIERSLDITDIRLYTVKETAAILKTNTNYVYDLIKRGLLPSLKLGSYKVRKESLYQFLLQYEGYDLTNPDNIVKLRDTEEMPYLQGNCESAGE